MGKSVRGKSRKLMQMFSKSSLIVLLVHGWMGPCPYYRGLQSYVLTSRLDKNFLLQVVQKAAAKPSSQDHIAKSRAGLGAEVTC